MRILPAFAVSALAAVALVAGLPGAAATATTATPSPNSSSGSTSLTTAAADAVTVSLAPADNGVVAEGADLTTTVTIRNGTDTALDAGVVRLYLDRQTFSSRSQLEAWFARPDDTTTDALGAFMITTEVPAIRAGATSTPISVTIPSSSLQLNGSDWGAKAFGARYSVAGTPLTEQHSSVVYYPNDSFQATRLGVAVPLTVPESTSGLVSSEALASYTSRNGILTQELEAVRGKHVAIGIDPMILASIRILGNVAPPSALAWLNRLERVPNETFALAYGDSDLSALRQAGATRIPTPVDFSDAIATQLKAEPDSYTPVTPTAGPSGGATAGAPGATSPTRSATPAATPAPTGSPATTVPTTESLLAFPYTIQSVAWPLDDTVSSADLPVFASSGVKTTILSSDNVKSTDGATENASVRIGSQAALVSDDTLSDLLREASTAGTPDEWKSDVAELSAQLATLSHERPSDARTLFATVPRNWATTGSRLDDTLTELAKLPWASSATMRQAVATSPTTTTLSSKKASASRVELLRPLVSSDSDLTRFATALSQPQVVTSRERLRMLALSSTSWSDNGDGLRTEIAKFQASVAKTVTQVRVVRGSDINVLGDRSSLPVMVQNDTASSAVIYLRVVPSNYNLNIEKSVISITVQPKSQQRITVPVQSVANGKVNLTLSLTSKTGEAISSPSQVAINVRAGWETAITLIFGVAVVIIFGGGIYRSLRRRQRSRRAAAGESDSGSTTGTGGASSEVAL